jgi:hypothetical protein
MLIVIARISLLAVGVETRFASLAKAKHRLILI